MKKALTVVFVTLMMIFGNYQLYAQVLCHKSDCCGCCPADGSGVSPCKCKVRSDKADSRNHCVSAVTVSKVFVRVFYSPVVMHSPVLNDTLYSSITYKPFKPDVQCTSLAISTFQIPLRI